MSASVIAFRRKQRPPRQGNPVGPSATHGAPVGETEAALLQRGYEVASAEARSCVLNMLAGLLEMMGRDELTDELAELAQSYYTGESSPEGA